MNLITVNYTITTPSISAPILTPGPSNNIQETKPASIPRCSTAQNCNKDPKATLLRVYPDCFRGFGCFSGDFHITLDPNVLSVIHSP